ncbi:hypothetical protein COBT_000887 [Conglomerata obtusa]
MHTNILTWSDLTLTNKNTTILNKEAGKIKQHTLIALLGPSGAGKTSLLNALAGRVPSGIRISGSVMLFDKPRDMDKWPTEVAYVEQNFYAYMNQTVYETIAFSARLRSKSAEVNENKQSDIENEINEVRRDKFDDNSKENDKTSCSSNKKNVEIVSGKNLSKTNDELTCNYDSENFDKINKSLSKDSLDNKNSKEQYSIAKDKGDNNSQFNRKKRPKKSFDNLEDNSYKNGSYKKENRKESKVVTKKDGLICEKRISNNEENGTDFSFNKSNTNTPIGYKNEKIFFDKNKQNNENEKKNLNKNNFSINNSENEYKTLERNESEINETSYTSSLDNEVNKIIKMLGLKKSSNTKLKSISGGELKRVSIGTELVGNPLLLFLDEPTSGLDSFSALNLIEMLKKLSKHSTILMTVHQPSYKMSTYFDSIHVLSQGNTIFQGSIDNCIIFFRKAGYSLPENTNPCDYFLDLIAVDYTSEKSSKESLKRIEKLKQKWLDTINNRNSDYNEITTEVDINRTQSHKGTTQNDKKHNFLILYFLGFFSIFKGFYTKPTFLILWRRNVIELLRDRRYLIINIVQKLVFTLLLGLAYLQLGYSAESVLSRTGVIFFILINALFGTAGPIFNIFPSEKKIIYRERKSGLYDGITAYFAKYLALIIFDIGFYLPYIAAVYWMTGLNPNAGRFFIFLIIIISSVIFATSLGLTIGTISPSEKFAQVLGTTSLIIFIVFGGGFNNPDTIPGWLRWLIWISPVNYAFRAAMNNQYRGLQFEGTTGNQILAKQGIDYPGVWSCLFGLWGLTAACLLFGAFSLHFLTRIKLKLKD